MELENPHEVNTADEFWSEIEQRLAQPCQTHDDIDDALRSYLALLEAHHQEYITSGDHLGHCAYLLYASPLFTQHSGYVRQQLVHCLLQEDDFNVLRIAVTFLLADAREHEKTFDTLNNEGAFPRLVELVAHPKENEESVHRTLMELMYEMARIQKITNDDLTCVNDEFVCNLFDIIEQVSDDVNDPYHYPVIRVLLVLNEQFMVAAHDPAILSKKAMPITNKVVKVLSSQGSRYKTFGANIILLLNREDETSLQLLTLKLMYLLFTTPPTYEYFYTNDLRVLVDILIRNLLDLPEYAAALRHTYLRVLYPLLEHTQLQYPPYYKRQEVRKLLALLCGDRVENDDGSLPSSGWNHFEDVDETTKRLVRRCQTVSWLSDPEMSEMVLVASPTDDGATPEVDSPTSPTSPTSPSRPQPPQLPAPRKLRKRDSSKGSNASVGQFLSPQLEAARQSSISIAEMAQQKERPGVITPSRNPSVKQGLRQAMFAKKEKEKPPPPKARRSGFMRPKPHSVSTELEMTRQRLPEKTHTPEHLRNEAERYEDAVEEQKPESELEQSEKAGAVRDKVAEASQSSPEEVLSFQTKKPPPAPKARRGWRIRRSKDHPEVEEDKSKPQKEPGRFSARMPSVNTNTTIETQSPFSPPAPADGLPEDSPFSPAQDKTLDPLDSLEVPTSSVGTAIKRSVSDAMNQAQARATQQVEDTLQHTHIVDKDDAQRQDQQVMSNQHPPTSMAPIHMATTDRPPRTSSLQNSRTTADIEVESPSLGRTESPAILAPPGQAPIRGVPGPRIEVESSTDGVEDRAESPFLSQEESDEVTQNEDLKKARSVSTSRGLRSKESWEDFEVEAEHGE